MNRKGLLRALITFACILSSLIVSATTSRKPPLPLHPTQAQVDSMLRILDKAIEQKNDYRTRRAARIDSLVKVAEKKRGLTRIKELKDVIADCSHFNGKKTMEILNRMTTLPEYQNDKDLRQWILDSRAYVYAVMGMYHRSYDLLHDADISHFNRETRIHHYEVDENVINWTGNTFCVDGAVLPEEKAKMETCTDSLVSTSARDYISNVFALIDQDLYKNDYSTALKRITALYPITKGQNETYIYAVLSDIFTRMNQMNGVIFYAAKTSLADIEAGTTEYMCLPVLAQDLFKAGDIDRAYNYVKCCIDDAHYYPCQYLIIQATNMFPMIDKAYQQKKKAYEKSHQILLITGFCTAILIMIIVSLLLFLKHRQKMMKKLELANNVKNVFIQNMEHELHTPMNAIDGFAQLLDMDDNQLDEASRKEMTSAIRTSSNQMKMMIDNIIMLTEYDDQQREANLLKVDLDEVFCMLELEIYNPKADAVDIMFRNEVPADFEFISSSIHISNILKNLIYNGLKFTEQGSITISSQLTAERQVALRVSDTGSGIDTDKIDTVFERFTKVNEFKEGVGLGLPLCKKLTTLLGGEICVEKSDSHGTTFMVTLPSLEK